MKLAKMKVHVIIVLASVLVFSLLATNGAAVPRSTLHCHEPHRAISANPSTGIEAYQNAAATTDVAMETNTSGSLGSSPVHAGYGPDDDIAVDTAHVTPAASLGYQQRVARKVHEDDTASIDYGFGEVGGYVFSSTDDVPYTEISIPATVFMTTNHTMLPRSSTTTTTDGSFAMSDISVPATSTVNPDHKSVSRDASMTIEANSSISSITTDGNTPRATQSTLHYSKISTASISPHSSTWMHYGGASTTPAHGHTSPAAPYANAPGTDSPTNTHDTVAIAAYGGLFLQQGDFRTVTTTFLTTGTITITLSAHNHVEISTYTGEYSVILETIGDSGYGGGHPGTVTITQGTVVTATDSPNTHLPVAESGLPMPVPTIPTPVTTLYLTHTASPMSHDPTSVESAIASLVSSSAAFEDTGAEQPAPTVTQQSQATRVPLVATILGILAALMFVLF
jgi:hypothetical protein